MFRGCHLWVYSLVCAFCILSMLFLDTYTVKAASPFDSTVCNSATTLGTFTFHVTPSSQNTYSTSMSFTGSEYESVSTVRGSDSGTFTYNGYSGSTSQNVNLTVGGHTDSITGSLTVTNSNFYEGYYHIKIPVWFAMPDIPDNALVPNDYYGVKIRPVTFTVNGATVDNIYISDAKGVRLGSSVANGGSSNIAESNNYYVRGIDLLNGYYLNRYGLDGFIEFDISFAGTTNGVISFSFPLEVWTLVRHVSSDYQDSIAPPVSDPATHEAIEEGNEIAQDTNNKVTNFFDSFFDNLLHIFVPEDGYFSQWFNRVNSLLSDKLGMLYAPFDLVITTLQAIYNADSSETGIPFPGIQWENTWIIEPFTFTFASLGSAFDNLRDKVYFATDTVLVLTFLMLLQSKVKLILEGHE